MDGEAAILWAETLDSIGAEECAAIISSATISGELHEHWSRLGWIGGLRYGSGERGKLRRELAETAALAAAIGTGTKSIERMGTELWAATWRWDYAGAAAAGLAELAAAEKAATDACGWCGECAACWAAEDRSIANAA